MKRSGYTLIELLAAVFIMIATIFSLQFVTNKHGLWWGMGAALTAGTLSCAAVVIFYRWVGLLNQRGLQKARDQYRGIYRVVATPTDPMVIMMPEGAEIRVGDFGWEAGPSRNDGLIYLQGLTLDWTVVWHAGLRPCDIERVGIKPCSQYDAWYPDWAKPPPLAPCPFPVVERETMTSGRPHYSHRYSVQPSIYHTGRSGKDGEKAV